MYVIKDSGVCLFGCARSSHCGSCCGPPTAFPCGLRCTVDVLARTHRCALMPRVASRQSANPLWLLECGLVNIFWWSSEQGQRDCTLLFLYVFRVSCLATILDSWSLECENTYRFMRFHKTIIHGFELLFIANLRLCPRFVMLGCLLHCIAEP